MADEFDDLRAKYGGAKPAAPAADEYADLRTKYVKPAPVDMGPEARRARAGMSPGARDVPADEGTGPTTGTIPSTGEASLLGGVHGLTFGTAPAIAAAGTKAAGLLPSGALSWLTEQTTGIKAPPEALAAVTGQPFGAIRQGYRETEKAAQAAHPTAYGASELVGAALVPVPGAGFIKGAGIAAKGARAAVTGAEIGGAFGAGEAVGEGAGLKETARRAGTGALTGAIAAPVAAGAGALVAKGARAAIEGAPGRVLARAKRNLTETATSRSAGKIEAVAGPEDKALDAVLQRNPQLTYPLSVQAAERPGPALKAVTETHEAANAARNADIEAMQAHYAEAPPASQATISGLMDDYRAVSKARSAGDSQFHAVMKNANRELREFGDRLREQQGLPPAVNGDYSGTVISPKDLRAFEQTIGAQAYEGMTPANAASAKRRVGADLYKPLAKQMDALAEGTPGVDAVKFRETGQDIHVLIPIRQELQDKVVQEAAGRQHFAQALIQGAKHHASTIAGMVGLGAGAAAHSPELAALVPAAIIGKKVAGAVGRRVDYGLTKLAGRAPAAPAAAATGVPAAVRAAAAGTAAGQDRRPGLAELYASPAQ